MRQRARYKLTTFCAEAFADLQDYEKAVQNDPDAKDFKPPGEFVISYEVEDRKYEVWAGSLADPEVRKILDRMQVLVSLFIEAGTPLETDDPEWTLDRWRVYFVYVCLVLISVT